jgi:hypothetical protein
MVTVDADEVDDEAETFLGKRWEPVDETPVLAVVGKRETVSGGRIVHPLDEFAERPEEVVDLLRSGRGLALADRDAISARLT